MNQHYTPWFFVRQVLEEIDWWWIGVEVAAGVVTMILEFAIIWAVES